MTTSAHEDRADATAIRPCGPKDRLEMLLTINAAAEAYRGAIPADRWHDPYMSGQELTSEIAEGVVFTGYATQRRLVGVMGIQHRGNVDLIRHAYVLPDWQGRAESARRLSRISAEGLRDRS